ncbi:MAG: nuclear transport factor 2 family protein [Pontiellaceae bacterium]|nr:nuclear transport factor 2 family protein [Pontiellaceae bacterium]MBN2785234.1 nuclear transport factor 2 family protein [Pontiellaceae bacterium]
MGPSLEEYRRELKRAEEIAAPAPGCEVETEAIHRFEAFYAEYSAEAIRNGIRSVYANDAWFGDPYHSVKGIAAIENYFVAMAEPVEHCTFTVDAMQRAGNDYYARWTMHLVSKAAGKEPITAIGNSHLRFNKEGQIIFQQDYWDTSVLLDRLPVVGFWTRLVKEKIMKGISE